MALKLPDVLPPGLLVHGGEGWAVGLKPGERWLLRTISAAVRETPDHRWRARVKPCGPQDGPEGTQVFRWKDIDAAFNAAG